MTNGDAGHFEEDRLSLAVRRKEEAARAAAIIGVDSVVLDNADGALLPTLEVRRQVISLIRRYEADVVITHRPNDYHPDHRYTSLAVQDAAYMVTVPHVAPEVAALRKNPVFLYFMDTFSRPAPFEADAAVAVDDVMTTKWQMLDAMESQFYEWLAWHDGLLEEVPEDRAARLKWLEATWGTRFQAAAKIGRKALERWYGKSAAAEVGYAELFEVSEYGHRPSEAELKGIFPFVAA